MNIRTEDMHAISRLLYELAEFPAASPEASQHCLDQLAVILGARNAFWIGAIREGDPSEPGMRGWRTRAVSYLYSDSQRDDLTVQLSREQRKDIVDPQTRAMIALAGRTRACLRRELVDNAAWRKSAHYNELLRPLGVHDRLLGSHFVASGTEQAESYIGLDRATGDRPFGVRERNLLQFFLQSSPGFNRDLLRARGLVQSGSPLSPRESTVLRLLLTDMSEREIAAELGLTWRSTHQYVVAVLRKFGVHGRVGLMALWLQNLSKAEPTRMASRDTTPPNALS